MKYFDMPNESRISTKRAPKPVGLYPHARKVGDLLFLSGVGPRVAGSDEIDSAVPGLKLDKNGNFIEFNFAAQCRSVFDNVKIILEESGSSWDQLVDDEREDKALLVLINTFVFLPRLKRLIFTIQSKKPIFA